MDDLVNMKNDNNYNSIMKALLIFYLLIASNYCNELFGRQIKTFISENRYAQHTLGLITMFVIITFMCESGNVSRILYYTLISYTWFILTTKLDIHMSMMVYSLILLGILTEIKLLAKEKQMKKDSSLSHEGKEIIRNQHKRIRTIFVTSAIVLTIIGSSMYLNKKIDQYDKSFNIVTFFVKGPNLHKKIEI